MNKTGKGKDQMRLKHRPAINKPDILLKIAIDDLETAIQSEMETAGFGGYLAEMEVCKSELSKALLKMQNRAKKQPGIYEAKSKDK